MCANNTKNGLITLLKDMKGEATIEQVADAIIEYMLPKSYSQIISEMNDEKVCPTCGQINADYKRTLRAKNVKCLQVMFKVFKPMSSVDIKKHDSTCNISHFKELELWGLIKPIGKKKKGSKYILTTIGIDFIKGNRSIPKQVCTYRDASGEIKRLYQESDNNVEHWYINDVINLRQDNEKEHFENAEARGERLRVG